jgi:hypothetical protein
MMEQLEDLEVIPATKSPHGYLTSQLTDNIHMTDEGYLVIVGCPIARTGWQKYAVKDLPQARADALGVDTSNPEATIELYRPAKEVFHPEFLASLNGKSITDGHPPNGEFVDPKNFKKYTCGHIQNPRKGTEPLEDGEWPIIADLVISDHRLIEKVKAKTAREISLGYDFGIDRDGDKIIQCNMAGNHNAIVPDGRAGDHVAIQDAQPADLDGHPAAVLRPAFFGEGSVELPEAAKPVFFGEGSVEPPEADKPVFFGEGSGRSAEPRQVSRESTARPELPEAAYPPIPINFHKERQSVATTKNKLLRLFMGKHLIEMARATDADPEKIMEAADALNEEELEPSETMDKKAKDGELPEALREHQFKKGSDKKRKAKDDDDESGEMEAAGRPKASDKRKKMHDALDRALDAEGEEDGVPTGDADVEELKKLLDEFLSEEEKESEHADDALCPSCGQTKNDCHCVDEEADPAELEAVLAGEAEDEECPDCGMAGDACECEPAEDEELDESGEEDIEDEDEPDKEDTAPVNDSRKRANDARPARKDTARATDGARAVLKMLRPVIARTGDKAVQGAFNRALDSVTKSSRASAGSYGRFAASARARDAAPRNPNPDRIRAADGKDPINKMQEFYNSAHKGGK